MAYLIQRRGGDELFAWSKQIADPIKTSSSLSNSSGYEIFIRNVLEVSQEL
jgi:hypothetical protein